MNNFQINNFEDLFSQQSTNFKTEKEFCIKDLPDDLIEAVIDSRERKNLHGPFKTSTEAIASMLED